MSEQNQDVDFAAIPKDPATRKALLDGIQELVDSKTRQASETSFQTEAVNNIAEKTGVTKTLIRNLAAMRFQDNKQAVVDKMETTVEAYELLYGVN